MHLATKLVSLDFHVIQRRTDQKVIDCILILLKRMLLILADCVFFGSPYDAATTFRMGARFEYIKFMAKKN